MFAYILRYALAVVFSQLIQTFRRLFADLVRSNMEHRAHHSGLYGSASFITLFSDYYLRTTYSLKPKNATEIYGIHSYKTNKKSPHHTIGKNGKGNGTYTTRYTKK